MTVAQFAARLRLLFRPDDDRYSVAAWARASRAMAQAARSAQTRARRHP